MTTHPPTDDFMCYTVPAGATRSANPWFDRFYFNINGPEGSPFIVCGVGTYPGVEVIDGYVVAVTPEGQRNLRIADVLNATSPRGRVGPLRYACDEAWQAWSLQLGENETGVEFDVSWRARAAAEGVPEIAVGPTGPADAEVTAFSHYFQPGVLAGWVSIDGVRTDVTGWLSQRDRSRGLRRARDKLGLHLWIAVHFPEFSVGCNFNLDRNNNVSHCDGAVLYVDGRSVGIAHIHHAFELGSDDRLRSGRMEIELTDGSRMPMTVEAVAEGLLMAGGGYGGWHGVPRGPGYMESEVWPRGSVSPRELALGLMQTPCKVTAGDSSGYGVIELALSRSATYEYVRSL